MEDIGRRHHPVALLVRVCVCTLLLRLLIPLPMPSQALQKQPGLPENGKSGARKNVLVVEPALEKPGKTRTENRPMEPRGGLEIRILRSWPS